MQDNYEDAHTLGIISHYRTGYRYGKYICEFRFLCLKICESLKRMKKLRCQELQS